jgi:hypothetical protein
MQRNSQLTTLVIMHSLLKNQGLEDQLLGEVVRCERRELEEARDRLVVSIAVDKRQLQVRGWAESCSLKGN